jgi:hypothetical protein
MGKSWPRILARVGSLLPATPANATEILRYRDVKNLIYFYPLWAKNPPYYAKNRKNKPQGGLS